VDDVDAESVSLKWEKPKNDGGKKVTGYVVEYKEPDSNRWKTANDFPCSNPHYTGTLLSLLSLFTRVYFVFKLFYFFEIGT